MTNLQRDIKFWLKAEREWLKSHQHTVALGCHWSGICLYVDNRHDPNGVLHMYTTRGQDLRRRMVQLKAIHWASLGHHWCQPDHPNKRIRAMACGMIAAMLATGDLMTKEEQDAIG